MALLVAKVPFWEGASKGVLLSVIHSVFSKTQLCRNKRVSVEKNRNLPKIGGCFPTYREVFFGGLVFFSLFFVLLFCKKAKKGYFPASIDFLKILLPKRPVFKILLFFLCCLFFVLLLSSLSNFHFVSYVFVHQPLFGKHHFGGFLLSFFFLPFPFLMFAP